MSQRQPVLVTHPWPLSVGAQHYCIKYPPCFLSPEKRKKMLNYRIFSSPRVLITVKAGFYLWKVLPLKTHNWGGNILHRHRCATDPIDQIEQHVGSGTRRANRTTRPGKHIPLFRPGHIASLFETLSFFLPIHLTSEEDSRWDYGITSAEGC